MNTTYALLALAMFGTACTDANTIADQPADFAVDEAPPTPIYMTLGGIVAGGDADIEVTGARPGRTIYIVAGLSLGQGPCTPHACSDVQGAVLIATPRVDSSGIARATVAVPPNVLEGDEVFMQAALVNRNATSMSPVVSAIVTGDACPTVDRLDPYYDRFEGTFVNNACNDDADCAPSGCSNEVCAADPTFTTCEVLPYLPTGDCGCVANVCVWNDVCP